MTHPAFPNIPNASAPKMSHGETHPTDWQNIVTIRPGPVMHVWRSGAEFCAVPLTHRAALNLIGQLTAAMQMSVAE